MPTAESLNSTITTHNASLLAPNTYSCLLGGLRVRNSSQLLALPYLKPYSLRQPLG